MELKQHGAYGVTVNTEVCGTSDESSILSRHPTSSSTQKSYHFMVVFLYCVEECFFSVYTFQNFVIIF